VRRALPLLAVTAVLSSCGSHATPQTTPSLSALLARGKSVHFVVDGTVKLDLNPILARLHPVPPFHVHGVGDASRLGLRADGTIHGDVSGTGTVVVAGNQAYARVGGAWYDLGTVRSAADLLHGAQWHGRGERPRVLQDKLHVTSAQLEDLSGLSVPFGVDGAQAKLTIHLSRWGEHVSVSPPREHELLPFG